MSNLKAPSKRAACWMSNIMMDVCMSQISCQCSVLLPKYKHSYSHVCKYVHCVCARLVVCVCIPLTSLLSLGIRSYRWLFHEGNGLMSQGENIIVALTFVWKCSEWASCCRGLTGHHQPHQRPHWLVVLIEIYEFRMMIERLAETPGCFLHLCVKNMHLWWENIFFCFLFFFQVRTMKCLFEEMWDRSVFSQRAEIPAVFSLDHAPVLSIPPQIHIKVRLLKEALGKYILKLSVTSLSRHQLEAEREEEGRVSHRHPSLNVNMQTQPQTRAHI